MTNASQQTHLPELLPTPLSVKASLFVGSLVLAGYVVALVAQAANII
ncbi:hypothetical protein [Pyruvatibacter sp.]